MVDQEMCICVLQVARHSFLFLHALKLNSCIIANTIITLNSVSEDATSNINTPTAGNLGIKMLKCVSCELKCQPCFGLRDLN